MFLHSQESGLKVRRTAGLEMSCTHGVNMADDCGRPQWWPRTRRRGGVDATNNGEIPYAALTAVQPLVNTMCEGSGEHLL